jgi:hypothetical protein
LAEKVPSVIDGAVGGDGDQFLVSIAMGTGGDCDNPP